MMRWRLAGGMGIPLAIAVFCTLPLFTSSTGDIRHHGASRARGWRSGIQPSADVTANNSVSNVTAQLGGTAYLHCLVGHLSERGQVSWIRKRDWHILSSGKFTYTNDERFQVLHGEGSEDWTLQIKFVQKRDNGTYECQVSTRTGIVSHYVRLQIVVPEAFILGSGEHHVDLGSVIHLICIVEKSPTPPQYVFWYHNDRMINYDATRGGITVETEPGARTQSRLTVRGATLKDSGNYTCSASNTEPASIHVFVSEGSNKMAAILRRNTSAIHGITSSATCLLLLSSALLHFGLR
ncbi:hemicentin-2-like isoform X1 [Plodia interpunctella]|uniref:hemicentin-2-like isoform X1 n=2 Tax=Plodia interpunctella TaxID=58824 RepID=UPI002367E268|nr:hemicentin-2-like isoform X1 [Plodia interpunctella]